MSITSPQVRRLIWLGVIVAALVVTIVDVVALASRGGGQRQLAGLLDKFAAPLAEPADKAKTPPDKSKPPPKGPPAKSPADEQADRVSQRNIFAQPKPPRQFNGKLVAIMGDDAIFEGNQVVKVGGTINEAKLLEIGPDWVQVEFDGKPVRVSVGQGGGGGPGGPGGSMGPGGPSGRGMVMMPGPSAPPMPMPSPSGGPPPGFKLTPEMIEQFKSMPPEMRAKALAEMPQELRDQLKQAGITN